MQDLPDRGSLLGAVAKFLSDERFKKEIKDPALLFRMRIAAHVVESIAREESAEEKHDFAELLRLEDLLDHTRSTFELRRSTRQARIRELNAMLAAKLRTLPPDDPFVPRAHEHLRLTLIDKLSVTNPRFDTSPEIE